MKNHIMVNTMRPGDDDVSPQLLLHNHLMLTEFMQMGYSIMARHENNNTEIGGCVAVVKEEGGDVETTTAIQLVELTRGNQTSVEPWCNGLGRRQILSKTPSHTVVVVGEWHTHPHQNTISPPSGSDLFQLLLASARGNYSWSCVFATEGIWFYQVADPEKMNKVTVNELQLFYKTQNPHRALEQCREPILTSHPDQNKCPHLHRILNQTGELWRRQTRQRKQQTIEELVSTWIAWFRKLGFVCSFVPRR